MSLQIPTQEPLALTAGDTWTWQKSFGDYPAGTWTLTYYLRGVAGEISFSASASGTDHLVSVAKAATAAYKAGLYQWNAVVTDGTSRVGVGSGKFQVRPDPASTGAGFDPRSHARKVLDAINAVIEKRATIDQQEYAIEGRSLKRMTVAELTAFRDYYVSTVFSEDNAERRRRGLKAGRMVVKF